MSFGFRQSVRGFGRIFGIAVAALCAAGFARAENAPPAPAAPPLLWKIEGAGKKPSWIFGTIHLARPDVAKIRPQVAEALAQADAVYTEIPSDMPTMLALTPRMMLPAGQTLPKLLGPQRTADLKAELKAIDPSLDLASLSTLKPWAMAATLSMLEDQIKYPGTLAIDMVIFQRAAMAGKRVGGIETPDEQVAAFEDFTEAEQIAMIDETIRQMRKLRAQGVSVSDLLTQLYLAGDLDRLLKELMQLDEASGHPELTEKFLDRLLYRRNAIMAGRITKMLRNEPGTSWFFAVGAGHLQGDRGLIADFEKAGFKLTRVR